ncbi:MAG: hypothetical protein IT326_05830, partial [Anaerolineae bacterium]|nr:hypothetical protein [Anaerolineae bacterium]
MRYPVIVSCAVALLVAVLLWPLATGQAAESYPLSVPAQQETPPPLPTDLPS